MARPIQGRPPEFVPKLFIALGEGYSFPRLGHDLLAGLAPGLRCVLMPGLMLCPDP